MLNADPLPVHVEASADNPARQPFAATVYGTFADFSTQNIFLLTPPGKRGVMENLSCRGRLDVGRIFTSVRLQYEIGSDTHFMDFLFTRVGTFRFVNEPDTDIWVFNQPIRAYFDRGAYILLETQNAPQFGQYRCHLSGHFVDID